MNLPMASRQGSTGALARRLSEYELVRDFFASTTVVLLVDLSFLLIFLVFITILAGWLVAVPLVGIALMVARGLRASEEDGPHGARRPSRRQPSAFGAGRIDRRSRDAQGCARGGPDARPLAALFGDDRRHAGGAAPGHRGGGQPHQPVAAADQRRPADWRLLPLQCRRHVDGRDHRDRHARRSGDGAGRSIRLPHDSRQTGADDDGFAPADDGGRGRAPGRRPLDRARDPGRQDRARPCRLRAIPERPAMRSPTSASRSSRASGSASSAGSPRASRPSAGCCAASTRRPAG